MQSFRGLMMLQFTRAMAETSEACKKLTVLRETPWNHISQWKTLDRDGICILILVYFTKKSIFSVHFHANN
jgi:hypothetical protein